MNSLLSQLAAWIPQDVDWLSAAKLFGIFLAASLLLGLLFRAVLGKRSGLNHAVSSAMGILCIYAVTIVIYTFDPIGMARFLTPLPFVTISGETLRVFSFTGSSLPVICAEILSMVILAFLVNLLDSFIPKGRKMIGWYGYRFLTVILAMVLHYVAAWLAELFLPGVLVAYAPMILLGILLFMLLLGAAKVVLGVVLVAVNPVIGALYTFFFANIIGKQISKSVFTTALLCGLVFLLEYFGITLLSIAAAALVAYIPLILIFLVLWYLFGHVL